MAKFTIERVDEFGDEDTTAQAVTVRHGRHRPVTTGFSGLLAGERTVRCPTCGREAKLVKESGRVQEELIPVRRRPSA